MIDFLFSNETHLWILISGAVFTWFGRWTVKSDYDKKSSLIIEFTIDRLINDGFIKTKKVDGEIEIMRYDEES